MNKAYYILLLAILYLLPAASSRAHSVHVFARVENGIVHGEGYMSGGKKVIKSDVQVLDKENGVLLLTLQTDEQGKFSFAVDELEQAHPVDLLITLDAGPGHRSSWELTADQYASSGHTVAVETPHEDHSHNTFPPLINIVAGIGCIFGLGTIVMLIKSKKRGSR